MTRSSRLLALLIILAGIVAVAMGITYIAQGVIKSQYLSSAMQQEQITLGIESEQLEEGEVIDTAKEAEIAGDTIRAHRRSIAPTYGALLGDEQYDPSNPQHLTYAQALNLQRCERDLDGMTSRDREQFDHHLGESRRMLEDAARSYVALTSRIKALRDQVRHELDAMDRGRSVLGRYRQGARVLPSGLDVRR